VPKHLLPRSETIAGASGPGGEDLNFIGSVVERWRGATMSHKPAVGEAAREPRPVAASAAAPLPPLAPTPSAPPPVSPALDPNRFGLLKRPLTDRPDHLGALRSPAPPSRWPTR